MKLTLSRLVGITVLVLAGAALLAVVVMVQGWGGLLALLTIYGVLLAVCVVFAVLLWAASLAFGTRELPRRRARRP